MNQNGAKWKKMEQNGPKRFFVCWFLDHHRCSWTASTLAYNRDLNVYSQGFLLPEFRACRGCCTLNCSFLCTIRRCRRAWISWKRKKRILKCLDFVKPCDEQHKQSYLLSPPPPPGFSDPHKALHCKWVHIHNSA